MKATKVAAFLLALLVLFSATLFVSATEESTDIEESSTAPDYDYCIEYGYNPLVSYDGAEAADYIKGKTPATAYLKKGDNHIVSENYYSFRDYVFAGWRSGGKLYKPGEIIYNVSSDMTMLAEWVRPPRPDMTVLGILSYSKNGKVVETVSLAVGESVKLKDGYWQDGYGRIFNGGASFLMSFSEVSFTEAAKGNATVSVSYDGGGVTSGVQSSFAVKEGDSFLVDGCYGTKEGYSFSGWSDGNGRVYTVGDTCVATKDVTLTAIWRENEKPAPDYCTVNVGAGMGGKATPEGKSTIEKGNSFSFTVEADEGYKLISVTCDGAELGTGGEYTLTVNADMIIKAVFEKLPEPVVDDSSAEEESTTASAEENSTAPTTSADGTDDSTDGNEGEKSETDAGKIIAIIFAVIVCVGGVVLAAWFSSKSNKKRKRRK